MAPGFELLTPDSIAFSGNFLRATSTTLTLSNPTSNVVHFRVKTTTPHRFVVKPHRGSIDAQSSSVVGITLNPFHYDADVKARDKFLLLAVQSNGNDNFDWSDVPADDLFQKKIRCVYNFVSGNPETVPEKSKQPEIEPEPKKSPRPGSDFRPQQEIRALRKEGKELRLVNEQLRKEIERLKEKTRKVPGRQSPDPERSVHSGNSSQHLVFIVASVLVFIVGTVLGRLL